MSKGISKIHSQEMTFKYRVYQTGRKKMPSRNGSSAEERSKTKNKKTLIQLNSKKTEGYYLS
jgi:hypothetical protein